MGTRKPKEAVTRRTPDDRPRPLREAGVRAALRQRRRRRADEAGLQALVRTLSTQLSTGRER